MISSIVLNILGYYVAIALATGFTSYFSIYKPILKSLQEEGHVLWELDNPAMTACILMLLSTLFAPILIKATLFGASEEFIETYKENILNHDDDE